MPIAVPLLVVLAAMPAISNRLIGTVEGYVDVPGGGVWYRVAGSGNAIPLLVLHGGPGGQSDYLFSLGRLGDERPVIFYDQLGCGRSDRPTSASLWQPERFVAEIALIRKKLGLRQVHILGHSWGAMLAVDYALSNPARVRSLVLSSPALSLPRWLSDANDLRAELPAETQATLASHESDGTTNSPEYHSAVMQYYKRHVCRMEPWPQELTSPCKAVYEAMWGTTEFHATGVLRDYDRTGRLGELHLPVLFTAGRFDEARPETVAWYKDLTPGSTMVVFERSAHMAMLEEPDEYVKTVRQFLRRVESSSPPGRGQVRE